MGIVDGEGVAVVDNSIIEGGDSVNVTVAVEFSMAKTIDVHVDAASKNKTV